MNIARGKLLDYDAVLHHLKSGHLGGLGTDVAWTEPFDPDDAILKFPNVIMTPHVAGVTEYSYRSMAKVRSVSHEPKPTLFWVTRRCNLIIMSNSRLSETLPFNYTRGNP